VVQEYNEDKQERLDGSCNLHFGALCNAVVPGSMIDAFEMQEGWQVQASPRIANARCISQPPNRNTATTHQPPSHESELASYYRKG
jgi:hypothetical protein